MRIGKYAITAVISGGRHATVAQARDAAGRFVAVKLPTTTVGEELIAHEQQVLSSLSRAVDAGTHDGRPWTATDWVVGAEARVVATDSADRRQLLQVCRAVARAYAALHATGVVHGQVHPRHILMEDSADAALLDFSVAASAGLAPPPARLEARFSSLGAPEQAWALLEGRKPRLTPKAEQFSVAALLYLLVTGRMYAPLRLQRDFLPVDIVDASPLPFAGHGVEPWPDLERVLGRALSREPSQRFESTSAFAAALAGLDVLQTATRRLPRRPALSRALDEFKREAYSEDAIERIAPPTCSINFGAAGVAYALTRLGKATRDREPFEHAQRWLSAAYARSSDPDAFEDHDEVTPETIGTVSPFHTASGLAVARALLSEATGDIAQERAALDEYRTLTGQVCHNLDLTLGRSSVLLVAALLLDRADGSWPETQQLVAYGDNLSAGIWRDADDRAMDYNGIAHGWAGLAYASLMWSQARAIDPPGELRATLDKLVRRAEPWRQGSRWPVRAGDGLVGDEFWPGWCHGNAGYVFLWNLAYAVYRDDMFESLAERAADLMYGGRSTGFSSLCCGSAGQAYALLSRRRATGDDRWLVRAAHLAERSATSDSLAGDAPSPISLYKGYTGLALLAVELEQPDRGGMPLFEFEPQT